MKKRVIVIGGTGMLGRPVAERLNADGHKVTVMSTRPDEARPMFGADIGITYGDVTKPETLRKPFAENDAVYLNLSSHLDPETYETLEVAGTVNAGRVAAEVGMERVACISGASSKGVIEGPIYLSAKVRAENGLIESGVPYTIMRPSWFFETIPNFVQQGRAVVLGKQPIGRGWLAASDYARQVSRALGSEEAANKCFYNLGPEKLTIMEALRRFCERHFPDLEPEHVSFAKAKFLSKMPGMGMLKPVIPFFEYFETNPEDVDPTEANDLLGANNTSLDQWLDTWSPS